MNSHLLKFMCNNRRFYSTTAMMNTIKQVTVIGSGLMGQGNRFIIYNLKLYFYTYVFNIFKFD